mmetsp:Transcript_66376/g.183757  ORF Transcript_66376/g.183757 Transcript_66376/m.183757 type:complete len:217 (-) Transcript_66376:38-688(-)
MRVARLAWRRPLSSAATGTVPATARPAHEVLGVGPAAPEAEVRAAFRRRALHCHPDRVGPEFKSSAEEEFKALEAAYSQLLGRCLAGPDVPGPTSAGPASGEERTGSRHGATEPTMPLRVAAFLCLPVGILAYEATIGNLGALRPDDGLLTSGGWACPRCFCTNDSVAARCQRCRSPHAGLQYAHLESNSWPAADIVPQRRWESDLRAMGRVGLSR